MKSAWGCHPPLRIDRRRNGPPVIGLARTPERFTSRLWPGLPCLLCPANKRQAASDSLRSGRPVYCFCIHGAERAFFYNDLESGRSTPSSISALALHRPTPPGNAKAFRERIETELRGLSLRSNANFDAFCLNHFPKRRSPSVWTGPHQAFSGKSHPVTGTTARMTIGISANPVASPTMPSSAAVTNQVTKPSAEPAASAAAVAACLICS